MLGTTLATWLKFKELKHRTHNKARQDTPLSTLPAKELSQFDSLGEWNIITATGVCFNLHFQTPQVTDRKPV
jgi:hypothetical protein